MVTVLIKIHHFIYKYTFTNFFYHRRINTHVFTLDNTYVFIFVLILRFIVVYILKRQNQNWVLSPGFE